MKNLYPLVIAGMALIGFSCSEESNPKFDKDNFTKVYDNNRFDASNYPIDMKQTPDGGYIILGGRSLGEDSEYAGIYLMKVDENGNFIKEIEVEATSVHPVGNLTEYQTRYYFMCMGENTQAKIATVDANLEAVTMVDVQGSLSYPAAMSFVDNNFVVVGYNNVDQMTTLSIVNPDGGVLGQKNFSIGVGMAESESTKGPVIQHFMLKGRHYPFTAGKAPNGLYYFTGFYNYTFSLVFSNMTSDDPVGVVNGQHVDGGFSALLPLGGNKFAASIFNYGDNFLLPNKDISSSGVTSSTDLGGYSLPELVPNATVRILRTTVNTKNVLVYGTDTKSKQIGLLFYDESTGSLVGSRYLGFSNPYQIASVVQTIDGGLAVCGKTQLAGRFGRICVIKMSKTEFEGEIKF